MAAFWFLMALLSLSVLADPERLNDGEVKAVIIDDVKGGNVSFHFFVNSTRIGQDLFITTTTFSDWGSPEMYVSAGQSPTIENHDFASSPQNIEELEISAADLHAQTEYYILAHCSSYCRFNILISFEAEVRLPQNTPVRFTLDAHQLQVFTYEVEEPNLGELTITLSPFTHGQFLNMTVSEGGLYGAQEQVVSGWILGQSCTIKSPKHTTYWIVVMAEQSASFVVAADASNGVTKLQASIPSYGVVGFQHWKNYQIYVDDSSSTVYLMETIYSGSPVLYIKAGSPPALDSYDFLSVGYDNETISIDKHQRQTLNMPTGWYYVGVYGQVPSAYILTVSVNINGMVPLNPGVSYAGYVDDAELFYFYLDLPPKSTLGLEVKVTTLTGELSLYVKLCEDWILTDQCKLTADEMDHANRYVNVHAPNAESFIKEVSFQHSAILCPQSICRYTVLVVGRAFGRTSFLISASIADTTVHTLQNSVPASFYLIEGQSLYLKHQILDERVIKLIFQLTVFTGRCSLCVSPLVEKPSPSQCSKTSNPRGDPSDLGVTFTRGVELEMLNFTFYVTIKAQETAAFSIVSSEVLPDANTIIRLFKGQIQRDLLHKADEKDKDRYYSFEVYYAPGKEKDIFLTLTSLSGDFDIFISNNASDYLQTGLFHYQWSSDGTPGRSERENSIHIRASDENYQPISTYLVLLSVKKWLGDSPASYSLVYTTGDGSITTLQKGTPVNDFVPSGSYHNYALQIPSSQTSITITISSLTGDPDLYLSKNNTNRYPNQNHYDYSSANYGSEVITIQWVGDSSWLYIAVFGYTDSEYVLSANVEDGSPTFLVVGRPQVGKAVMDEYRFYTMFINPAENLLVTVTFLVGETRMFANLVRASELIDWELPTSNVHTMEGTTQPSSNRLSLQPSDIGPQCGSYARCRIDMSILCISKDCRFEVTITQSAEIQLSEGIPAYGICEKNIPVSFRFYNERDSTNILITASAVTSGDLDLYVSKDVKPIPSDCMWRSVSWGNEFLQIPSTDQIVGPSLMKGDYFLSVLCDRSLTFTVSVTTNPKALIRLVDGQPHDGFLRGLAIEYFYYASALPEDVIISLMERSGAAVMYVITHDNDKEDIYDRLPNETFYAWKSPVGSDLVISHNDTLFCTSCNFVIGIESKDISCQYTLLARNAGHITTLLNGQPFEGRLLAGKTRKYVFEHYERSSLDMSLAVFAGSPRMYIDSSPLVSPEKYMWRTHRHSSVQHVHVLTNDTSFHIGLYYILVDSGDSNTFYSLTSHSSGSVVRVITGRPQTYSTDLISDTPLVFEYLSDGNPGVCKVVSNTKDYYPTVYATFTETKEIGFIPGKEHADKSYSIYDIFYELKMPLWGEHPGKYLFSVFGNTTKSNNTLGTGDFEFYCLSYNQSKVILLFEVEYGLVDTEHQRQAYQLDISLNGTLVVIVSPCSGKLELVIRADKALGAVDVREKREENGRIALELKVAPGKYYIYVTGLNASELQRGVSFELTTSFAQSGQVDSHSPYYAGNSGQIEWKEYPLGSLYLSWSPPETSSGDTVSAPQLIRYRVYATSRHVSLSSACSMDTYEKMGEAWLLLPDIEVYGTTIVMIPFPQHSQMWVNVLAIIDLEESPEIYHVPYTETEVKLGALEDMEKEMEMREILACLAVVVFLLLLALIVLILKYRSAKKLQLRLVEMLGVETITMDFNKALKSSRGERASLGFTPLEQDSSRST